MYCSVINNDWEAIDLMTSLFSEVDADVTFSRGIFWHKRKAPVHSLDINPQLPHVLKHDAREPLPFGNANAIVFDPPFLAQGGETGRNHNRFGSYPSFPELWEFYFKAMKNCYKALRVGGFLYFKNQDCVNGRKQYWSHIAIYQMALEIGFYPRDLLIKLSRHAASMPWNFENQSHVKKTHCYWWVLEKTKSKRAFDFYNEFLKGNQMNDVAEKPKRTVRAKVGIELEIDVMKKLVSEVQKLPTGARKRVVNWFVSQSDILADLGEDGDEDDDGETVFQAPDNKPGATAAQ